MICCHIFLRLEKISTHALTWSATSSHIGSCAFLCGFQLTHSRGVRPTSPDSLHSPKNFNSRTHVECDPWLLDLPICIKISTHALTWSATAHLDHPSKCQYISTHALTWSATGTAQRQQRIAPKFQLTHSRGVRPRVISL